MDTAALKIGDHVGFVDLVELVPEIAPVLDAPWYCAVVKLGKHRVVEADLARMGYRTFYPKMRKWRTISRVKRAVERPVLSQYLFVQIGGAGSGQSFADVANIREVSSMVSVGGVPCVIPSAWVERCIGRYLMGEWDFVRPGVVEYIDGRGSIVRRENAGYDVGSALKIIEGEFAEMLAVVTKAKGHRLTVKIGGTTQHVTLHDSSVMAA